MNRKRSCATARRIERLKLLGRLADELLTPEAADRVIESIGVELVRLGIHPWMPETVDPKATIN